MTCFMENVLSHKRKEVKERKKVLSFYELDRCVRGLNRSLLLSRFIESGKAIIAEIKKKSPSKGFFFSNDRIKELAMIYMKNNVSAVSLVTEKQFFKGSLDDLRRLKMLVKIPVLRKDFIIDEYQILESKYAGADAVLLIVSLLSFEDLVELLSLTEELGMEALVEIHNERELQKALDAGANIIGINNRDLTTLKVDLNTSMKLLPLIPDEKIKVVESGIRSESDLSLYKEFQVHAFLIGEALVTSEDPGKKLKQFFSVLDENG